MGVKSVVIGVLLVVLVFTVFSTIISDLEGQYSDTNIDKSNIQANNSWTQKINSSSQTIQTEFETIGDDKGLWFLDAAIAIPKVIVSVIALVFTSIGFGIYFISSSLPLAGLSSPIVGILVTIFFVSILFTVVHFWRRSKT